MGKQRTRELIAGSETPTGDALEKVERIFTDHLRLAAKSMKLDAALHTGYTAAANFIAQNKEARGNGPGSSAGRKGGVKEGT